MQHAQVLKLYMTMPDMMRSGHRMECDDIDVDEGGIIGDLNHNTSTDKVILLVSKKSYDLIQEADLVVSEGVLLENIYTDVDLNYLQKGSIIEIGEVMMEVTGPCEAYGYLSALSPELPDVLQGNRGIFVRPVEEGRISLGDEITIIKKA